AFAAASAAPACAVPPSPTVDPEALPDAEPAFDPEFDAVPADVEFDDPDVVEREEELELRDEPLPERDEPLVLDEDPDVDELDDDRDVDPVELRALVRPLPLEPGPWLDVLEPPVPELLPVVRELPLVVPELPLVVLERPLALDPVAELVELDPEVPVSSSSSSDGQLLGSGMPSMRLATYVEWPSRS
ncbi:hypothetical protein ACFQDG_18705, partial [Natronoarchaeum mannanilyticum]